MAMAGTAFFPKRRRLVACTTWTKTLHDSERVTADQVLYHHIHPRLRRRHRVCVLHLQSPLLTQQHVPRGHSPPHRYLTLGRVHLRCLPCEGGVHYK